MSAPIDLTGYINGFFKFVFGPEYTSMIHIFILSILLGIGFLVYYFVILRKNPKEWKEINGYEKIVISFVVGILFFFLGGTMKILLDNLGGESKIPPVLTILFYSIFSMMFFIIDFKKRNHPLDDIKNIIGLLFRSLLILGLSYILIKELNVWGYVVIGLFFIIWIIKNRKKIKWENLLDPQLKHQRSRKDSI